MESFFGYLALVFFAVVMIYALYIDLTRDGRNQKKIVDCADENLGFNEVDGKNIGDVDCQGVIDGRAGRVARYFSGSGKNRQTRYVVMIELAINRPQFTFALLTDAAATSAKVPLVGGLLSKTMSAIKAMDDMEDLETGIPDFDRDWIITTNQIGDLRRILDDSTREIINKLPIHDSVNNKRYPISIQLIEGNLILYPEVLMENYEYLCRVIKELGPVATRIEEVCS